MSTLRRRWLRTGNRIGVWMYRSLDGRLSSGRKDVHVLVLTTPGRRTGIPRSTCVRYLETDAGYVVWPMPTAGQTPDIVELTGHPASPVYILDLGFVVPLMILTGVWLRRGNPWGYVASPIMLLKGVMVGPGTPGGRTSWQC